MLSVNLYKPGKINAAIDFPESWNELELPELKAIAKVLLSTIEDKTACQSVILLEILKHRAKQKKIPVQVLQLLDPEGLAIDGLPLVEFIYADNKLTKQPYPVIKTPIFLNTLQGLENDFENITAGEFEACEIYFLQFKQNQQVQYLAQMAAILYRPKNMPFITYQAATDQYITYDHERLAKHFLKMDSSVLFIIYLWYMGCRNMLPLYFPTLYEGGGKGSADLLVFTKSIHAAAGAKNGTRDQVRRTLLKALFFEMEQEAIKAKELKEAYEQ